MKSRHRSNNFGLSAPQISQSISEPRDLIENIQLKYKLIDKRLKKKSFTDSSRKTSTPQIDTHASTFFSRKLELARSSDQRFSHTTKISNPPSSPPKDIGRIYEKFDGLKKADLASKIFDQEWSRRNSLTQQNSAIKYKDCYQIRGDSAQNKSRHNSTSAYNFTNTTGNRSYPHQVTMKNSNVGHLVGNQKAGALTPTTFSTGQVLRDRLENMKKTKDSLVRESRSHPQLDFAGQGSQEKLEGSGLIQLGIYDKAAGQNAGKYELKGYQVAKNFLNKNLKKKNKVSFEDESKYLANLKPGSKSQTHEDPSRNYGFPSGAQGSNAERPQIQFIKNFKCAQNNELEINTSKNDSHVPASPLNHSENPEKPNTQSPKPKPNVKPTLDKFLIVEPDLSFGKNSEDSQEHSLPHPKPYLRKNFTPKKNPPPHPHNDHSIFTPNIQLEKCSKDNNHNNNNDDTRDEIFKDFSGIFNNSTSFLDKSLFSEGAEDFNPQKKTDFMNKSCNSKKDQNSGSKKFGLTNAYGRNSYRGDGADFCSGRRGVKV